MYRNRLKSLKSVGSWETIYQESIALFLSRGYEATSIRSIAKASNCSLGTFYRYFYSKEEIVIALYEQINYSLQEEIIDLPKADIATRFSWLLKKKIEILSPYKSLFGSLLGSMLNPEESVGIASRQTEVIRILNITLFKFMVDGATDCPKSVKKRDQIIRSLYGAHLLILFSWQMDRSPEKGDSRNVLRLVEGLPGFITSSIGQMMFGKLYSTMDEIVGNILDVGLIDNESDLSYKVLEIIFKHRKISSNSRCAQKPCKLCLGMHIKKVNFFVSQQLPIHLVLPAFPAKSPNPTKVLGQLPDLGEEIALQNLQYLCDTIQDIYSPGARISICADGRVFSEIVRVNDEAVTDYTNALKKIVANHKLDSLEILNLEDFIQANDFNELRSILMSTYSRSIDFYKKKVKDSDYHKDLFNGLHRFIQEDQLPFFSDLSKSQFKQQTKETVYHLMQRSDAWSKLLHTYFPHSVRLSIHPHHEHASKIGIKLTKAVDNWITPWHGVVVLHSENGYVLDKKEDAVKRGAKVIYQQDQPFYLSLNAGD